MRYPVTNPASRLLGSLSILLPAGNRKAFSAAAHLVAAEVVRENPIPGPEEADEELVLYYT